MLRAIRDTRFPWASVLSLCLLLTPLPAAVGQEKPSGASPAAGTAENQKKAPTAAPGGDEDVSSLLQQLNLKALEQNTLSAWATLLVAIFLGVAAGKIAAAVLRRVGRRLEDRGWTLRAHLFGDLASPASLALLAVGLALGLANLQMSGALQHFWSKTLLLIYSIAVTWYIYNLVGVVEVFLQRITAKTESPLDDQLVPLVRKTLRIFLVVLWVTFVVDSVFEQNVGAWLAGLGIAGLAVSLAAQDSLKNLFGSVTILLDRPFHVGERIIYAGYDGVIEEIGFRSTKVRTFTGSLVNIPNSIIVNTAVENVGRRPYIRRILNVTITYDTPREKIEQAVQILRDLLEHEDLRGPIHATIDGSDYPPRVYFDDFNPDSLNIKVIYWHSPPAYWDYMDHAQRLNLRIFEEFDKAGIEFAFPTQTLYLAGDPKRQLAVKMLGQDLEGPPPEA